MVYNMQGNPVPSTESKRTDLVVVVTFPLYVFGIVLGILWCALAKGWWRGYVWAMELDG